MDIREIRVKAFLKLIRYAEHKREDDGVYMIIFGGGGFTDMSKHPNKLVKKWGRKSTAAGAYQITKVTWDEAKHKGVANDFSRTSQDKIARWKFETKKAISHIEDGDIEQAIPHLRTTWTSLPGAKEAAISMTEAKKRFETYIKEYGGQ